MEKLPVWKHEKNEDPLDPSNLLPYEQAISENTGVIVDVPVNNA